jgi:malonyl-CoA O-methyltransferase
MINAPSNAKSYPFNKAEIARTFNQVATRYDQYALLPREIGERLLARLALLKTPPRKILDLGAGTGWLTQQLRQRYPKAQIIGADIALKMMQYAQQQQPKGWFKTKNYYCCSDAEQLCFKAQSVDLVISNCAFQWCNDYLTLFREIARILTPQGTLFFSSLGPDTLKELRHSFAQIDNKIHIHSFIDMHDIGDNLLRSGFKDPVMEMEKIVVEHPNLSSLLRELKGTGSRNLDPRRAPGLSSANLLKKLKQHYQSYLTPQQRLPATFEVIYGHAWPPLLPPQLPKVNQKTEQAIPLRIVTNQSLNHDVP